MIHRFQVSLASTLIVPHKSYQDLVDDRVKLLLNFLPKNTTLVSTHEIPITGLYRETILEFNHPFFPDGIQVELDYERIIWPKPNNEGLEQGEIIIGIRFLNKNGEEISVSDLMNQDFNKLQY